MTVEREAKKVFLKCQRETFGFPNLFLQKKVPCRRRHSRRSRATPREAAQTRQQGVPPEKPDVPSFVVGLDLREAFAFFRLRVGKTLGGKLFVSRNAKGVSSQTPLALLNAFSALPRRVVALRALVRGFAASASGGLNPFSEEKGFKNPKKTFFASRC